MLKKGKKKNDEDFSTSRAWRESDGETIFVFSCRYTFRAVEIHYLKFGLFGYFWYKNLIFIVGLSLNHFGNVDGNTIKTVVHYCTAIPVLCEYRW